MIDAPRSSRADPVGAALVVGGGIGGVQAALDLAGAGIKVYLVDRKSAVGGVMAQLDKTFPTNDCAMCTLAPRLADLSRHPDIELLMLSEVTGVTGEPGRFEVTVTQQPRYVDGALCVGCGICADACPVTLPSEFDLGLSSRKAMHRFFPQAVPSTFAISRLGVSPCQAACPIHQSGQGYTALIAQGRFEDALQVILRDNPLPSICGRVCTHPCTAACTRRGVDDPVNLPALKRFVTDRFPNYRLPVPTEPDRPETVAIVGSGPAGLTCAHELRQRGYRPVIYEALPVAGGMLAVGIPSFRLPRAVLNAELQRLRDTGIELKVGVAIGRDIRFEDLRREHSAVFLAVGAHVERALGIPGENLGGVTGGVEFLRRVNLQAPWLPGREVLVIGGGNSALDAARAALRCGAGRVTVVYRRTRAEMPADHREVTDAEREGVAFRFLAAPRAFIGSGGHVVQLECAEMRLGPPDASGRATPVEIPGSRLVLSCDAAIVTIGQTPDLEPLGQRLGLATTPWGTLEADPVTLETHLTGVFAGGDCVSGPDVVVNAMLAGKKAAISIDRWLRGQDLRAGREHEGPFAPEYVVDTTGVMTRREIPVPALDPATRGGWFNEVHTGYSEEQARAEAARCLACGQCSDCRMCVAACDRDAIDFTQGPSTRTLRVGAIILAPGYDHYDARGKADLGYGRLRNVITAPEFERILSASGPFEGHVVRPSDHRSPKRIAFIQCVGSRDAKHDWCSSVCCMYATKEALIAKEHCGAGLETDIYFMDARAFGKGFEAYYQRALAQGVSYIRCRPPVVEQDATTGNVVVQYLSEDDVRMEREYDLVVLSTGLMPPRDAHGLASTFGIALDDFGFCRTTPFDPVATSRAGVFACGPFTEPKDIPETVMQASGAASRVLALLREARGTLRAPRSYPPELDVAGLEPRVGVFVCHCGTNIAGVVDVAGVAEYAKTLPNVVYAETNLYTCSTDTQVRIRETIHAHRLNRVVVASCSPRTHEPLFRGTCREAGLNPYLFEMANIRDQCSWVHMAEPERATRKAKDLVRMAVAKARLLEPLQKGSAPVRQAALVVGGGLAGMVAALDLADQGYETHLVEREPELGGNLRRLRYLQTGDDPQAALRSMVSRVHANDRIHVHTGATVAGVEGSVGHFTTTIARNGARDRVEHGVIVVATGAAEHRPREHLYGEDERVVTQLELEERLASRGAAALPATVVMIQCVGSRDAEHPYCSRVCCAQAVKNALKIRELSPRTRVYVLYRDIRTYGFQERLYTRAREQGVVFLRHEDARKPVVSRNAHGELTVTVYDPQVRRDVAIEAGLVALSVATVPHMENAALGKLLKVPLTQDGFFLEAHLKLRPVDFATDGIFVAGLAHGAKSVSETVAQASAAVARAGAVLAQDAIELEATISHVVKESCDGCAYCVDTCPFNAITLVEYTRDGAVKKTIEINEALCKGCGTCQATCPKRGVFTRGFTLDQIAAQVAAALEVA